MKYGLGDSDFLPLREPHKFFHNERFRSWFAWVCRHCGIVKLEDEKGPERYFCDICRLKERLGTGPLIHKQEQEQ